jgi:hypothetical protein
MIIFLTIKTNIFKFQKISTKILDIENYALYQLEKLLTRYTLYFRLHKNGGIKSSEQCKYLILRILSDFIIFLLRNTV